MKLCAAALAAMMVCAACGAETPVVPQLQFSNQKTEATLGAAYNAAVRNLMTINTVPIKDSPDAASYNQTGLLATPPGTFIRAGGGYDQPWTRDASVNTWNAANLLEPEVARNTLWAVVKRQKNGRLIVQQDQEWWDQVVWVTAAWEHYTVTGNRTFLRRAYQASIDTLKVNREKHYNTQYGLFDGPAFLNDGIAGYPAPPADATDSHGSFVLDYPGASQLMVLSTNCLYVSAYRSAAKMAQALGRPASEADELNAQADTLAATIRKRFWIADEGRFGYLIHGAGPMAGKPATYQEGSGLAFAMLFNVATPKQARSILRHVELMTHGIPDVYPAFPRYAAHPGRHNAIVWPMVEDYWGDAAAREGDVAAFARAMSDLAGLANGTHGNFYEIYNGTTGKPDGGRQVGHEWKSQPNQTWSATAYLRMVFFDLFGLRFQPDGIAFHPTLPKGWGNVSIAGIPYRHAELSIQINGHGNWVRSFRLDGKKLTQPEIPATLSGQHVIQIVLK